MAFILSIYFLKYINKIILIHYLFIGLDIINIGQDTTKLIGENVKTNLAYLESLQLESTAWVLGLHQVLLFFLVIGRWMLPRGGIR